MTKVVQLDKLPAAGRRIVLALLEAEARARRNAVTEEGTPNARTPSP